MRFSPPISPSILMTLIVLIASGAADPADAQPREVSLVYINDVHAQIEPHPELFWSGGQERYVRDAGGLSRVATVFERLRAERPGRNLFLDGGDTIQGSGPAAWTEGRAVVAPTNALGLDVGIPGNWSVAYGKQALLDRAAEFDHPLVAANMLHADSGELVFEPYLIRERNGVRIGVLGFTEPDIPTRQPPHLSEGLAFHGTEILQPRIDELREERGVDVVVLATHIGLPKSIRLAEELEDVDVLLSADTHERTEEPIVRGETWVVEAGAFASFVGVLDLTVADGEVVDRRWRLVELLPDRFPEDPEVARVVDRALAPHRERMERVLGHTEVWLARYQVMNTPLDNVIADGIRFATGADVALSNGFRFAPATAPGPITVADLWNWLPLRLEVKLGRTTGARLQDYWEREFENVFSRDPTRLFGGWLPRVSGLTVDFDSTAEAGQRLRAISVAGEPLDPGATYTVAAGNREGAPDDRVHRVDGCTDTRLLGMTTHDAVARYLQARSPIRTADQRRVRCVVTDQVLRSQTLSRLAP
jgi:2',3'-cyclic-nucleotide 2'-phosphodiesterase (5'-nucleotidase family)